MFGVAPTGYVAARDAEKAELDRERVRLWYVATTRARELLILPRFDVASGKSAWRSLVDLSLPELPALELDDLPTDIDLVNAELENRQTREVFASEAAAVVESHRRIVWRAPSRDESVDGPVLRQETPEILTTDGDGAPADNNVAAVIQGGRDRGLILHKLIEEVLVGETAETIPELVARADILIRALGKPVMDDPALGLAPSELAGCVVRALSLPEVIAVRPRLKPEFPVYASELAEMHEEAAAGVADAIAFDPDGVPKVVIDWKSDVDPSPRTRDHYCGQVRAYLDMTGAERGLVVVVTSGDVIPVAPTNSPTSAL